ncbi:MAG: putative transporter ATP-binding protein YxlF [Planctomycetota bacterium]|jgi:ABC-2 type transport system ATP-binding protein
MLVATDRLTKRYGAFTALDACSLTVARGEVFGLLGPNGAGKTTLLRLLLGYLAPTSGSATVVGHDIVADSLGVRSHVAYLPGEARLFRRMNGRDVLDFFARLRPACSRAEAGRVADRLGLDISRQVARMSTGMRQKLALATVLATDVPLVILDEPTANLDPTARAEVLDLVREANAAGRTVIFSSHVLSEVEETCGRVAILRAGRLVHEQSIAEIRRGHRIRARLTGDFDGVPAGFDGHVRVADRRKDPCGSERLVFEAAEALTPLLGWLATLPLAEIEIEPIGLAAVYDRFHRGGLQPPETGGSAAH